MLMNNKKGFTLAELMVCIVTMAAIASMLLPAIQTLKPNKNRAKIKKAAHTTSIILTDMLNDEAYYANLVTSHEGLAYNKGIDSDTHANTGLKFCKQFSKRVSIKKTSEAPCEKVNESWDNPDFTTLDGIAWRFQKHPICDPNSQENVGDCNYPENVTCFDAQGEYPTGAGVAQAPYSCIYIDVNGKGEGNDSYISNSQNEIPDMFAIVVHYNGKMDISTEKSSIPLEVTQKNVLAN